MACTRWQSDGGDRPAVAAARPLLLVCFSILGVIDAIAFGEDLPAAIPAKELSIVQQAEAARMHAIEAVYGAVLAVYGDDRHGGGSGVLFDPAGYALTNHHVVAAAGEQGWAGLADGKLYRWKLIGTDPGGDLAVIKLSGRETFTVAPLGDSDLVRVGDWALAMGNPFGLAEDQRPSVSLGIVSGVKRFQEGSGLNQLVYGNCIQVDSSINPGNSGGPLFNLRGEIVGINGRGSFEERGRVNVGLGYAISSNQIKTFIPELLATKIAQHGTLDAVFGNQPAGVVCYTINTAAPAARAGLALGDKLLAFEGTPINDANQLTNLLSTYPAGWPVALEFEHEDLKRTIRVRLTPLPYERFVAAKSQPPEESPRPEPEAPRPKVNTQRPEFPLADAGKIRDAKLNQSIAQDLLAKWREVINKEDFRDVRLESEIRRDGIIVGDQTITIGRDGQLRVEYSIDGNRTTIVCDGQQCRKTPPAGQTQVISRGKALLDPHFAQGVALSILFDKRAEKNWGNLALNGADKAGGRWCYRLSITETETSEQLFLWLSVFDAAGRPSVELIKTGVGLEDDEPIAATLYDDWQSRAGLWLPRLRTLVHGLAEKAELSVIPRNPDSPPAKSAMVGHDLRESPDGPFGEAIEFAQQRTVKIFGAGIGRSPGYATGIIVSTQGEILTAQGVFLDGDNLRATLPGGKTHPATVVRRSTELQAALLKIDVPTPECFDLSQTVPATPGDWVLAVSNAFKVADRDEPLSVNIGVLGLRMSIDARRGVQEFPYQAEAYLYDAITSNPGAEGGAS